MTAILNLVRSYLISLYSMFVLESINMILSRYEDIKKGEETMYWKRNKTVWFGFGAAVLMILLAITPAVSSTQQPSGTTYAVYQQFFAEHQTELDQLEAYISNIDLNNPPEVFPLEIQELIGTLSSELGSLIDDDDPIGPRVPLVEEAMDDIPDAESEEATEGEGCLEEEGDGSGGDVDVDFGESDTFPRLPVRRVFPSPPYSGQTQLWMTSESIDGVEPHPNEEYIGYCLALDNENTETLRLILEEFGVGAAIVFIASVVAVVVNIPAGVILGIWLWEHRDEIIALIPTVNQGHGIRIFAFDAVNHVSFLWNIFYIDAQPGTHWVLPYPWELICEEE